LVQPIIADETFLHTINVDDHQAHGLVEVQATVLMASLKIEDKAFKSMLESPCHSMVDFRIMLVVEESSN
jgi:hypothetical protein